MKILKPKIVFLGTPDFSLSSLKALIESDFKPVLVVTQPDQPVGRKQKFTPPPIKELAADSNLKIFQPKNKIELKKIFTEQDFDLAILVAYGMIIPAEILAKPKLGFLNLHPSLLPQYRGSSPIQTAILNGDAETGVTIIKLTDQVDAGPVIASEKIKISPEDNSEILSQRLADLGGQLLISILPDYLSGKIQPEIQDEKKASFTGLMKREDGLINWQKSAPEIRRQFLAFYPWPGVFSHLDGKRVKIANLSVLEGDFDPNLRPGELFFGPNGSLAVKCGQGGIELKTVQLEGKKEMIGKDFLRGQKDLAGKILS